MPKDVLKALEAKRRLDEELSRMSSLSSCYELVSSGYKRVFTQEDILEIEEQRKQMRERLFAPG